MNLHRILSIGLLLSGLAPADAREIKADVAFEQLWLDYRPQLEAAGITHPVYLQARYWAELQYHLGACTRYLAAEDVVYWREWWKHTPLEKSEIGRQILDVGDKTYQDGLRDGKRKPLGGALCAATLKDWQADMKRLGAQAK